jgi:hypothetical protein
MLAPKSSSILLLVAGLLFSFRRKREVWKKEFS